MSRLAVKQALMKRKPLTKTKLQRIGGPLVKSEQGAFPRHNKTAHV